MAFAGIHIVCAKIGPAVVGVSGKPMPLVGEILWSERLAANEISRSVEDAWPDGDLILHLHATEAGFALIGADPSQPDTPEFFLAANQPQDVYESKGLKVKCVPDNE